MTDVKRLVRDVLQAGYYRGRPVESVRTLDSRRRYRRGRTDAAGVLRQLGIDPSVLTELEPWQDELDQMDAAIAAVDHDQGPLSPRGRQVLYGIVRHIRPDVVVETGVAAGASTAYLAAALQQNGSGRCYSIDLPAYEGRVDDGTHYDWVSRPVGWAIPERLRAELGDRLRIVLEDVRTSLPAVLAEVGELDVFFHDDLHTPDHMGWEYELVWSHLVPGGIMVSDDANHAWLRFTRATLGRCLTTNVDRLVAARKPGVAIAAGT